MKKYLSTLFLIAFIVPSIAFASWYNPFSWFNGWTFHKTEVAPQVQVETQKTPEEKISDLQKQLDDLKKQQPAPVSTKTIPIVKKEVKKTIPVVDNSEAIKVAEQAKKDAELKAKFAEQDALVAKQRADEKARIDAIDAQNALGKNYYIEAKSRVKTLIGIENSYKTWLQDTSDQFRSASLTLAGYSTGGLAGQARDAAIKLANAEISVISSLITNINKWNATFESVQDVLNNDPKGFVNGEAFNKIQTPESLEAEIEGVKQNINSSLDSVLTTLQFH